MFIVYRLLRMSSSLRSEMFHMPLLPELVVINTGAWAINISPLTRLQSNWVQFLNTLLERASVEDQKIRNRLNRKGREG
jgi:hypothetical protein